MDENKEMLENTVDEAVLEQETDQAVEDLIAASKGKKKNIFKFFKSQKPKKLKNQLLLKRGGYSLAITAILLAAVIVLNILLGALTKRFNIEFDLSKDKVSTMSEENIEYLENIDADISITVCASEENYSSYMLNYIQSYYGIYDDYSEYYNQTVTLINKYPNFNDKITVTYVDMYNDPAFDAIQQKYSNESLVYGDIIVSTTKTVDGEENERYKVVSYDDVYELAENSNDYYASMMGGSSYTMSGNNVETALTSAIAYVLGSDVKKAVIYTGHSSADIATYAESYAGLLADNNFETEIISTVPIANIPEDADVIALLAPVSDLQEDEVDTIVAFLENNGNLNRGLIYFGSSFCPALPNLNELMSDWNIQLADGKLFETSGDYAVSGDPTTLYSFYYNQYPIITSGNQAILYEEASGESFSVAGIVTTPPSVAVAPASAGTDWADYSDDDLETYATAVGAVKSTYNDDNEEVKSMVVAFSSLDYIASTWAENSSVYNKNITLSLSESAVQAEDTGISFVSKSITDESFTVTESGTKVVAAIFIVLIPLALLAAGIFIFIKRRNS